MWWIQVLSALLTPLIVAIAVYVARQQWRSAHAEFGGTAYRAANWRFVGITTGRGKLEKHHQAILPTKSIFLYPLRPDFKDILTR